MPIYLEHANLTVRDLDEAIRFLTTAIPEFAVRHQGVSHGRAWAHVGNEQFYIALNAATEDNKPRDPENEIGLNHLGFAVDDADAVANALRQAGFREGLKVDPHPYRKRVYFHDADKNEWEFVEYFTEDPAQRNEYSE